MWIVMLAAALSAATISPAQAVSIPFSLDDARPFVTVTANGAPYRFLLDTGSGGSNAISRRVAEALRLDVRASEPIGGANPGQLAAGTAVIDRFAFGPLTIRGATFT